MNTWNGSPQRELTTNTLSGKAGADQTATHASAGYLVTAARIGNSLAET
jgi:hypothetical protein